MTAAEGHSRLIVGDSKQYSVVELDDNGNVVQPQNLPAPMLSSPDARFDEGNSPDLSPVKLRDGATTDSAAGSPEGSGRWSGMSDELEDTFHYRQPAKNSI